MYAFDIDLMTSIIQSVKKQVLPEAQLVLDSMFEQRNSAMALGEIICPFEYDPVIQYSLTGELTDLR